LFAALQLLISVVLQNEFAMKRILLICFCLTLMGSLYPQTSFVKVFSSPNEDIPVSIKEISDSYFISFRTLLEPFSLLQGTTLRKLDNQGDKEIELEYLPTTNSAFNLDKIIPINNSEFIAIARNKKEDDESAYLNVIRYDTALFEIWNKEYKMHTPLIGNIAAVLTGNDRIVIGCTEETPMPNWQMELMFMEITTDGDSIKAMYGYGGNPDFTQIYSLLLINGNYKAFVNGFSSYVPYTGFSEILSLDTNLNLLGVKSVPFIIQEYMTAEKIDESRYYVTGKAYSSSTHFDVGIAKLSLTEDSLAYNHTGKPGKAVDYSGWKQCMSTANSNSIYTGGTGNDNGLFYSCYITNKVLMLSNYDSLLNCRWTRFYGSDTACYTLSTLEATSDGGCIMGGMFVTPSRPENLLDAVIIKVDSLGLFTGLHENTGVQIHEANIYPNPGSQIITVQCGPQIIGATFSLHDATGRLVSEALLKSTQFQVDVNQLSSGTYYWKIHQKGKLADSGKWIKQQD
jgi:hypothetical protein